MTRPICKMEFDWGMIESNIFIEIWQLRRSYAHSEGGASSASQYHRSPGGYQPPSAMNGSRSQSTSNLESTPSVSISNLTHVTASSSSSSSSPPSLLLFLLLLYLQMSRIRVRFGFGSGFSGRFLYCVAFLC